MAETGYVVIPARSRTKEKCYLVLILQYLSDAHSGAVLCGTGDAQQSEVPLCLLCLPKRSWLHELAMGKGRSEKWELDSVPFSQLLLGMG